LQRSVALLPIDLASAATRAIAICPHFCHKLAAALRNYFDIAAFRGYKTDDVAAALLPYNKLEKQPHNIVIVIPTHPVLLCVFMLNHNRYVFFCRSSIARTMCVSSSQWSRAIGSMCAAPTPTIPRIMLSM